MVLALGALRIRFRFLVTTGVLAGVFGVLFGGDKV
jgi:hypothetical protein